MITFIVLIKVNVYWDLPVSIANMKFCTTSKGPIGIYPQKDHPVDLLFFPLI